jgi:hypothetical protein
MEMTDNLEFVAGDSVPETSVPEYAVRAARERRTASFAADASARAARLTSHRLSTARFSWLKESRCFAAEASELPHSFAPGQIYPDAADEGLVLMSARTGEEVRYYLHHIDKSADNEIQGWNYLPVPEDARRIRGAAGTSVLIIND